MPQCAGCGNRVATHGQRCFRCSASRPRDVIAEPVPPTGHDPHHCGAPSVSPEPSPGPKFGPAGHNPQHCDAEDPARGLFGASTGRPPSASPGHDPRHCGAPSGLRSSGHRPTSGRILRMWGIPLSLYCRIVEMTAVALGYHVENIETMPMGDGKLVLRGRNPFEQIPTVEVDGMTLWESSAIARYLAGGTDLYPTHDRRAAVRVDMAYGAALSQISPKVMPLFYKHVIGPRMKGEAAPTSEEARKMTDDTRDVLRQAEQSEVFGPSGSSRAHRFLMGARTMSIADIAMFAVLATVVEFGLLDLAPYPRIDQWYATFRGLSLTRSVNAPFYRSVRDMGGNVSDADVEGPPPAVY
eukprot:TRINITY_DN44510_c0_g1_i1.p1 TRINITY_DN44510_c0_g1~~TRINITY_DN44510_c0_g1_i1.p1  ORF type:complete len:354 (+),score=47.99 TRINITY_DN44510_c0_g1_i1:80-1141(+)